MNTIQEMVAAVKLYANEHYNEEGWDSIMECYSNSELAEEITEGNCHTIEEAIAYVGKGCKTWNEYRMDIQAEAF